MKKNGHLEKPTKIYTEKKTNKIKTVLKKKKENCLKNKIENVENIYNFFWVLSLLLFFHYALPFGRISSFYSLVCITYITKSKLCDLKM
jgi:nitrate reductase NapAB chaperone NapD